MEKKIKIKVVDVGRDHDIIKYMNGVECELFAPEYKKGYRPECYAIWEISTLQELLDFINKIGMSVIITESTSGLVDYDMEIYDDYRE